MLTNNKAIERYRVTSGKYASTQAEGNNGLFKVYGPKGRLVVIASDGMGWEHVSVSPVPQTRVPTWDEMCFVKNLFWDKEECVVQYHPPESEYVNFHPFVLHLWKPTGINIPTPPGFMIAPRKTM